MHQVNTLSSICALTLEVRLTLPARRRGLLYCAGLGRNSLGCAKTDGSLLATSPQHQLDAGPFGRERLEGAGRVPSDAHDALHFGQKRLGHEHQLELFQPFLELRKTQVLGKLGQRGAGV